MAAATVGVAAFLVVIAAASSAPQANRDDKPKGLRPLDSLKSAKLETAILRVSREATTKSPGAGIAAAERANLDVEQNKVRVVLQTTDSATASQAVDAVGGKVEATASGLVQALVPPTALAQLGQISAVRYVRAPFRPQVDAILGEGVAAVGAPAWHTLNRKGGGAKVAVIDLGFEGLAASQASGDLPVGATTVDYCGGISNGQPHGVAVAEIVHEVAPDAELTLICIDSEVTLAQAEAYVEANGIKIVNHSVGWFNTSRGDGNGGPGSPDSTVAKAKAAGVLWVNSAGNAAEDHWSGTFSDPDHDNFHNFTATDAGNTFYVPAGGEACVTLKWDSWPTTSLDYDLYLARWFDGALFSLSTNLQNGTQAPTEEACFTNNTGVDDWFSAFIDRFGAATTPRFDMVIFGDAYFLEYPVAAGSLNELAASPNTFAAAAICYQNNALESFSSRGPTIDGRIKPDIAGQDAVSSSVYGVSGGTCGPNGFYGTSAAAPHTAGVAAVLLGHSPSLTATQLQTTITGAAQDLGSGGKDNSFGAGKLRLPTINAPKITSFTPASGPVGTLVTVNGSFLLGTNHVDLGGVDAAIVGTPTATQAKFLVPPASATGSINLSSPDGSATSATTFKVTPKLVSLDKTTAIRGETVVITGTTFIGVSAVRFNGVSATYTVDNDSQITATVPATATTGNVQITGPGGVSNTLVFTVILPPTTNSLVPSSGPVGTLITVNGANLGGSTNVSFAGTNAVPNTITAASLKATVPAGAQTGVLTVTNPAGTGGTLTFKVTPKLVSLSTTSGIRGSTVTITGTTFTGASAVKFNGIAATYTVHNDSQITATVPSTATTGNLQITGPGGTSNTLAFTVILPPTTSGLSPASGPVGTVVTVNGANLLGSTNVSFNGADATPNTITAGSLKATVPANATSGVVTVTNPAGPGGALTFKVTPKIVSLSTTTGIRGSTVVLTGTTFAGATAVKFNGVSAAFAVDNDSQITATVPATATTGNVQVTTPAGASNPVVFTVILPPTTSSLVPSSGPVGTVVTVNGTNLGGSTNVSFAGTNAIPNTITAGSLKATVPASAQTGVLTVTNPAGTGGTLTFKVTPKIASLSTTTGIRGETVVITGTTFTGATAVKFNGVSATYTVDNDNQITANVPATATTGNLQITGPGGTSNTLTFTVILPPTTSGLSPSSGPVGTVVTITGANLLSASKVTFGGGVDSTATSQTATTLKVTVPAGAQTGPLVVTNPAGTGGTLVFKVAPKIVSLNKTTAIRGETIVITGVNFSGATSVKFNGVNDPGFDPVADVTETTITAHVPSNGTSGNVVVTTAAGSSNGVMLTVTLPPTISSFTPTTGASDTVVTLTGTGFTPDSIVRFGNAIPSPAVTFVSSTQLKAKVPPGPSVAGQIQVLTPAGSAVSSGQLTVPLWIGWISPITAPPGTVMTMAGQGLDKVTSVKFGDIFAEFWHVDAVTLGIYVPPGAPIGPVWVGTGTLAAHSIETFTPQP